MKYITQQTIQYDTQYTMPIYDTVYFDQYNQQVTKNKKFQVVIIY